MTAHTREVAAARRDQAGQISRLTPSGVPYFLRWVADRLVCVYKESENMDFVHALHGIADGIEQRARAGGGTSEGEGEI